MTGRNDLQQPRGAGDGANFYYDTLLDSLADGVLSISPDHRIEVLNATGAAILGQDAGAVTGRTLIDVFLSDAANDAFMDAILAATANEGRTVKEVVIFLRAGEERRLAVVSTAYRVKAGAMTGKFGVVVTFNDVTEMLRLRTAEEAMKQEIEGQHARLRSAYLELENAAARERKVSRRLGLIRALAIAGVVIVFAGIGITNWRTIVPSFGGSDDGATPEAPPGTYTIAARPVTSRVAVVGSVDAGSVVSVTGPFDGPVRQKWFEYGGAVERGQRLVTVDVADTQLRMREAESAKIRARQRLDELRGWNTGIDVSRARRTVVAAEFDKKTLDNRISQTKLLLNKGIVAADEYNQLIQQQQTQAMQLEAAKQDLTASMERGSEENRRIAEYELLNAQAKVDELQRDLDRATVVATVSGVVLQPPEIEGKRPEILGIGSRVTRGQAMFAIGDLESLSIRARVDEIDINKVQVGQPAIVTGDAFDGLSLDGIVTSVAAQASGDAATRTGMATFPVAVQVTKLTAEQRKRVHIGMSATVSIVAYDNPEALVIPPGAIRDVSGKQAVRVLRQGRVETIPVALGISTPDGVEIREGLKDGDVVQVGD